MFQGAAALSLDAKGRLSIPARHRGALAQDHGEVVVTAHPQHCLLIYPAQAWQPIRDKILSGPSLDKRSAALKRLFVGNARDESLDGSGRVLIAPELRKWADLDKAVWLVGQGSHFELWSDERWQQQQQEWEELTTEDLMAPGLEDLSL
ncbi:division/cell wall cluster transcriptional repressor MraZ [Nitrogeniibacter aestuarii]|uniref:division/cell wall cluster transcriptional repressor MraZ n=1 Tax=Nitrogeniibacter aestuarii TaxID=2815343 RepID=UPI001D100A5C|nr:division/cell wall cluster transcriptional repressor MraZ [Nitrogeniibacter aestuarii]